MVSDHIEYARIADLYDTYVQTTLDVPFFINETRGARDVLELMSGTGRVSLPLARLGANLTCVDRSPEMLLVLEQKLKGQNLTARVAAMDVRELALAKSFDLILLPFHSFSELVTPEDQRRALACIAEHLEPGGRFICTLHNPVVRRASINGQLRLAGRYARDVGRLLFWMLEGFETDPKIVSGVELFEEYDERGIMRARRAIELRYRLVDYDEFEGLMAPFEWRVAAVYGDYRYAEFRRETSPFMIWVLQKP